MEEVTAIIPDWQLICRCGHLFTIHYVLFFYYKPDVPSHLYVSTRMNICSNPFFDVYLKCFIQAVLKLCYTQQLFLGETSGIDLFQCQPSKKNFFFVWFENWFTNSHVFCWLGYITYRHMFNKWQNYIGRFMKPNFIFLFLGVHVYRLAFLWYKL